MASINSICRACMIKIVDGFPLFEVYESEQTLAEILNKFTSSQVCKGDKLPSMLCKTCTETLIRFHNFNIVYEASNKTLNDILRALGSSVVTLKIKEQQNFHVESPSDVKMEASDDFECSVCNESFSTEDAFEAHLKRCVQKSDIVFEGVLKNVAKLSGKKPEVIVKDCFMSVENRQEILEVNEFFVSNIYCKDDAFKKDNRLITVKNQQDVLDEHQIFTKNINFNMASEDCPNKSENVFVCHVCGRTFSRKMTLKDHMDTHTDELKYECKICGKQLKGRTSLFRHTRSHTTTDRPMCEMCGQKFNQISSLYTHQLTHSNMRNFQCHICKQSFVLKATLTRHIRRHEQRRTDAEKNYKCEQCSMRYLDSSSLSRHVRVKHLNEIVAKCSKCDEGFHSKTLLARHCKVTHLCL